MDSCRCRARETGESLRGAGRAWLSHVSLVGPLSLDVGVVPSDAAAGFNYGLDKVRFLAPVPAGGRVRLQVVLDNVEERSDGQLLVKTKNTIEIENGDKPALITEALALLVPRKTAR